MIKYLQPLSGSSLSNWIRLLIENGGVDSQDISTALYISLICLATVPNRLIEKITFGKLIENTQIDKPPVFILGHWRSGTTYLNQLMLQDANWSYLSIQQASAPEVFFSNGEKSKEFLKKLLPQTRPFDNVKLFPNSPQEEEFALANMSPYSFYNGFYFPKNMKEYFQKYVMFEGVKESIKADWKKVYMQILKIVYLGGNKKRLLLKNPPNTARIRVLLEMFPNAKFIHIYRNPYNVYLSTKRLYEKSLPLVALQRISKEEIEENIILFYQKMMHNLFESQQLIPAENFIEIKHEEFEINPLMEIEKVYNKFNLDNFSEIEQKFREYIYSQKKYQKNQHMFDLLTQEKIYQSWKFTIDKWGYKVP